MTYAGMTYFGKRIGVDFAYQVYDASTVTKLSGPKSQCIACWSGGPNNWGHVGVVEAWYPDTETMDYTESNYDSYEKIRNQTGISRDDLEALCGSKYTFQGYVELK